MIAFDLKCTNGHTFEGWFEDRMAFETQKEKGLLTCPVCNSTEVTRIPSVFAIKSSHSASANGHEQVNPYEIIGKSIAEYINKNFEDVGCNFATEALKMHYGATEQKNIRGFSTKEEEKMLHEEGIGFVKIPIPDIPDAES